VTETVIEPPGPSMKRVRGMKKFRGESWLILKKVRGLHFVWLFPSSEGIAGAAGAGGVTSAIVTEPAMASIVALLIARRAFGRAELAIREIGVDIYRSFRNAT